MYFSLYLYIVCCPSTFLLDRMWSIELSNFQSGELFREKVTGYLIMLTAVNMVFDMHDFPPLWKQPIQPICCQILLDNFFSPFCFVILLFVGIRQLNFRSKLLFRHSAGCLVAVNTYFEAPERVAALILVAPAILAPYFSRRGDKGSDLGRENNKEDKSSSLDAAGNPFLKIFRFLSQTINYVSELLGQMVKGMGDMLSALYKKLLSTFLRSAFAVMLVKFLSRLASDK